MSDWIIAPKQGLGSLRFGMSSEDISKFEHIYGSVDSERKMEMPQSVIDETLEMFGDSVSEEDRQTFLDGIRQTYQGNLVQVRSGKGPVLVLEFDANGLVDIQIGFHEGLVSFQDQPIFELDAQKVLALLEQANGEPGRYRSTLAAFDNLALALNGFCEVSTTGNGMTVLQRGDERFDERTIGMRQNAYHPADEEFVRISVL